MQKEQNSPISAVKATDIGRRIRQYIGLLSILLAMFAGPGWSQEVDPYTVEIEVDDRSQAALNRVLPQALNAVLVKLSGQRQVSAYGAFNSDLKSWVDRYGYRSYKLLGDGTAPSKGLRAVISFRPGPVDHARATLGLPSWTGERPRISLWVAIDYSGERSFLPEGAEYARFVLADNAAQRGVYLQLPATTVEGELVENAPAMADIWGGFTEQLKPLTEALGADTTLLAAATNRMGNWQIRWNLSSAAGGESFSSVGQSLDDALAEGFNQAVDTIAASTAIAAVDQGQWREFIDILHLPDAASYQQLMAGLKQHRLIDSIHVQSATSKKLRLVLVMNTSPEIVWKELDSIASLAYIGSGVGAIAAVFEYQP